MIRRLFVSALVCAAALSIGCDNSSGGGASDLPIRGCAPVTPESSGDPHQDCVDRINQLRAECQHLPPLARWTGGEDCADAQAEYDSDGHSPHSGWGGGVDCDGGWGQNECPGWPSVDSVDDGCLQDMWDEGPGEPFSAHGHYINMTNPDYTEVACGIHTTGEGDVWAVMNFR
jgi:hypothetical protein